MSNKEFNAGHPSMGTWDAAADAWSALVMRSKPPLVVNGVEVAQSDPIYPAALQVRSMGPIAASELARRQFELATIHAPHLTSAQAEWGHVCKVDSLSTADIRLPSSVAARPHKEDMINMDADIANQSPKIRRVLAAIGVSPSAYRDECILMSTVLSSIAAGECAHLTPDFKASLTSARESNPSHESSVCDALFRHGVMGAYYSNQDALSISLYATDSLMPDWLSRDRIVMADNIGALSVGDSILVAEAKSGTQKSLELKVRELIRASVLEGENYRDAVVNAQISARKGRLPDCAAKSAKIQSLRDDVAEEAELVSRERAGSWSASLATSKDLLVTRHADATASNCTDAAYLAAAINVVGGSSSSVIRQLKGEGINSPDAAFLVLDELAYKLAHAASIDTPKSPQAARDMAFLSAFAGGAVKPMIADVRRAVYSDRPFGRHAESVFVTVTERQDKIDVRDIGYSSGSGSGNEAGTIWLPSRQFFPADVAVEDVLPSSAWRLSIEGVCEETISKRSVVNLPTAIEQFASRATERLVEACDDVASAALQSGEYRLNLAASAAIVYAAVTGFERLQFLPRDPSAKAQPNAANVYAPTQFTFNKDTGSLIGWSKTNYMVYSSRAVAVEDLDRMVGQGATSLIHKMTKEDPRRISAVIPVTMGYLPSAQASAMVADVMTGSLYASTAIKTAMDMGLQAVSTASENPANPHHILVQLDSPTHAIRRSAGREQHHIHKSAGPSM